MNDYEEKLSIIEEHVAVFAMGWMNSGVFFLD